MPAFKKNTKHWRIFFVLFLFVLAAGLISFRLYQLQIKNGQYYEVIALGQQTSFEETREQRGEIFLNQGRDKLVLAQQKSKALIYVFPDKIPDSQLDEAADLLTGILGQSKEEVIDLLNQGKALKQEISENQISLAKNANIKGIFLEQFLARFYPQQDLASHLIGFVNQEGIGQYGIEGHYNEKLNQDSGLLQKQHSPFGYLAVFSNQESSSLADKGISLVLSIDYNIQYFTEKLLEQASQDFKITSGQIIVSNPQTGKILALANFPKFNLNQYSQQESLDVFLNPATQKLFEPGSVFKPAAMAAALEEELITPETEYIDYGFVEAGGPPIYNFNKKVWGKQTMTQVLENSINTGAVFVQQKLGAKLFLKYLDKFGFFEKTGIDLQGEVFSRNDNLKRGYQRDLAAASFGQGVETTPIQLVRFFGAIANGGVLIKPQAADKTIDLSGKETAVESEVQRRILSEKTAAKLTSMLVSVVDKGSAFSGKIDRYYIAGKTSTAQVAKKQGGYLEESTIQCFIGFFPALNPEILALVKLDNPQGSRSAGESAVPLFRELAKYIIDLKQIPPDY